MLLNISTILKSIIEISFKLFNNPWSLSFLKKKNSESETYY